MFELTQEESEILRSQNATLRHGAHSKYLAYAFTEHGVLMLSNVLKSGRAIEMSIKIIDVFVKLREMLPQFFISIPHPRLLPDSIHRPAYLQAEIERHSQAFGFNLSR